MRREHDPVLPGEHFQLVERAEHLDVGIEVAHDFVGFEQEAQEPRLHRGGELEHVVDRRHVVELARRDVEVGGPDDGEDLVAFVDRLVDVVEHEHRDGDVVTECPQRRRQHPRVGEIVPRYDGAELHIRSIIRERLREAAPALSRMAIVSRRGLSASTTAWWSAAASAAFRRRAGTCCSR